MQAYKAVVLENIFSQAILQGFTISISQEISIKIV